MKSFEVTSKQEKKEVLDSHSIESIRWSIKGKLSCCGGLSSDTCTIIGPIWVSIISTSEEVKTLKRKERIIIDPISNYRADNASRAERFWDFPYLRRNTLFP